MHQLALNEKNILKRKASFRCKENFKKSRKFEEAIEDGEIYDEESFNNNTSAEIEVKYFF